MKRIAIADVTMVTASKNTGINLSFKEKIEIVRHLENLGVDVVTLPAILSEKTDPLLIRTIASFVKHSVLSIDVGMTDKSLEMAYLAVSSAKKPRMRVEVPVSPVQMEYVCHKKESKVLDFIGEMIGKAKAKVKDVEFVAGDATRAEFDFLVKAIKKAIEAGATVVTICDDEASMLPNQFEKFLREIEENVEELKNVKLAVSCKDTYSMATASLIMAMNTSVEEISVSAVGGEYASLDCIGKIFHNLGDKEGFTTKLKHTELARIIKQIKWIANSKQDSKSNNQANDILHLNSGIAFNKNDDIKTISKVIKQLGYDLSDEDIEKVFVEFKRVAEKKNVGSIELDAIISSVALQVPPTYKLVNYVVQTSNIVTATAHITIDVKGEVKESLSLGDGPIDSAFRAIEQIVGMKYELDDFQIQSVTEGKEAIGLAVIKLRRDGKIYAGNGISTDIIGSSISAYLSAVNKIAYEEA